MSNVSMWKRALLVGLLLGVIACTTEPGSVDTTSKLSPVAMINDEEVSRERVLRELNFAKRKYRLKKNDPLKPEQLLWLKTNIFNEMVQEILLRQEAERSGVFVEEGEFNLHLAKTRQGYEGDAFQRALEIEEINEDEWKKKLKNQFLIKKLIEKVVNSKVNIDDAELKSYFESHQEEFQKREQVHALHIMVEEEEEAVEILKNLEKGADFSDMAREHSVALEGETGGDMGYFEAGQMPEEFDEVFSLKKNELSDVIRTPYGFHVFKVMDKKPARKRSFEESRAEIHSRLLKQAQEKLFQQWIAKIKSQAKINVNHEVFETIS